MPRFHASVCPIGKNASNITKSGIAVALKNGAPTEIAAPEIASSASGYNVPIRTAAHVAARNRLLTISAPSRDTAANNPPCRSIGARHANSAKPPPTKNVKIPRINTPRVGSLAKECTDVSTPERTINAPKSDSEKVRIANRIVQTFSASRFSITTVQCTSAVPINHGISEAFSTGSQNHQPPQPSS